MINEREKNANARRLERFDVSDRSIKNIRTRERDNQQR